MAGARGRNSGRLASMALAAVTGFAPVAAAAPQGGVVKQGNATITDTPGTTTILQTSDKAIIDWRSFGIGGTETVVFNQLNGNSIALNRVTGNDPSNILGTMRANGQVWLVNPNGIVFAPGSTVDVHGLVATTADIRDDRFMASDYRFDRASANQSAGIVNRGTITLSDRGLAALVAPNVRNEGVIAGRLGVVVVAGAPTFAIDITGDRLLSFAVTSQVAQAAADGRALVDNTGTIRMDGGTVMLTAQAAAGLVDEAINTSGLVQAQGVANRSGTIVLISDGAGAVTVDGGLDAGTDGGSGRAGTLYVAGESVDITERAAIETLRVAEVSAHDTLTIDAGLSATSDIALSAQRIDIGARVSAGQKMRLRGAEIATVGDGLVHSVRLDVGSSAAQGGGTLDLNTDVRELSIGTVRGAGQFAAAEITNTGDLHVGTVDSAGIQAGSVKLENANGTLTLDQPIRTTSQGVALIAVTGGFVNNAGPDAVQTGGGQAIIYSVDQTNDNLGELGGRVLYGNIQNVPPGSVDVPGIVFVYQRNPNAPPPSDPPTPPPLTDEEVAQVTQPDIIPYLGIPDAQGKAAAIDNALIRLPPLEAVEEHKQRDLLFANDGNRDLWGLGGGR